MRFFRVLHHWFVPHETNNHRAQALHHESLLAYALVLCVLNLGLRVLHQAAPGVLGYATDIRVEQLLSDTNARRKEAGLEPLTLNSVLSQAAAAKAADMFAHNYWAHTSPLGKTPWDFIVSSGYKYTLAGENLAKNFQTSNDVVDAWMASPTHKANIVKSGYKDIGFAIVNGVLNGEETTLVVQMFGAGGAPSVAQIPKAEAAAPSEAPQKVKVDAVPVAETSPVVETKPIALVPAEPAALIETPAPVLGSSPVPTSGDGFSFQRVINTPKINISSFTNTTVFMITGMLIGLLAVDAYITSRGRIVRLVGHNIAHILFLGAMTIASLAIGRGSLI